MSFRRKNDYKQEIIEDFTLHHHHKTVYIDTIKKLWNNHESHQDIIGIEKYLIILILVIKMLLPSFWIRHYTEDNSALRWLFDLYIILKPVIIGLLIFGWWHTTTRAILITIYLMTDLFVYIIWLLILSDLFVKPFSVRKNLLLLWSNYMEIIVWFALLYLHRDAIEFIGHKQGWLIWPLDAVYYSMSTFSTVWYGDIASSSDIGLILTIIQLFSSIIFIGIVLGGFVGQIQLKGE